MTEPGWYTDPYDDRIARWHDGTSWTSHSMVKADWKGQGMPPPPGHRWRPGPSPKSPASARPRQPLPRWVPFTAVVVVVVVAIAAFMVGRSDDDSGKVATAKNARGEIVSLTSPQKVAEALTAAGFECSDYKKDNLEDDESFGPDPRNATGKCQHGGESVQIDTLDDGRHLAAYMAQGDGLGCSFGKAFGVTEINYAYGNFWTAQLEDDYLDLDTLEAMAAALGGKVHHKKC